MSLVFDRLPAHKGSLHLTHNQHKSYYETVEQAIQSGTYHVDAWVSQAQREKAIATDSVWELQWYPETPVGFSLRIACDLDAVLDAGPAPSEVRSIPAPADHSLGIIARFERAYPELFWHVAKGKISAGEPLYGAAIFTGRNTEIGHGESDESAEEAFRIAVDDAGLALAASEGSADA